MFPAKPPGPEDGQQTALLISPAEEDHEILQQSFQHHGWSLYAARSLDSARAILSENSPSLVITERELPVGSWKVVLEIIRGLPEPPFLIVISRLADGPLWAEALNLGVYDVLAKPLARAEVVRVLTSAWLQRLAGQMNAARRAYKEAVANYASVNAKYGDMLDHRDGTAAHLKAAQAEARASQKYEAAVKAWGAFLRRNCLSVLPETEL